MPKQMQLLGFCPFTTILSMSAQVKLELKGGWRSWTGSERRFVEPLTCSAPLLQAYVRFETCSGLFDENSIACCSLKSYVCYQSWPDAFLAML